MTSFEMIRARQGHVTVEHGRVTVVEAQKTRRRNFLRDFDLVAKSIESPEIDGASTESIVLPELLDLADRLECARRRRGEVLRPLVAELPDDDPLFNPISLFGTLDLGLRETAHTRALAWLLDPAPARNNHGFGDAALREFLCAIKFDPVSASALHAVTVDCESRATASGDRFDILVRGSFGRTGKKRFALLVEAKVNAGEGDEQCARYENHFSAAASAADVAARVFLSISGETPQTARNDWRPLSFLRLAAAFRRVLATNPSLPGSSFLRLYLTGILRDIAGLHCGPERRNLEDASDLLALEQYLVAP